MFTIAPMVFYSENNPFSNTQIPPMQGQQIMTVMTIGLTFSRHEWKHSFNQCSLKSPRNRSLNPLYQHIGPFIGRSIRRQRIHFLEASSRLYEWFCLSVPPSVIGIVSHAPMNLFLRRLVRPFVHSLAVPWVRYAL